MARSELTEKFYKVTFLITIVVVTWKVSKIARVLEKMQSDYSSTMPSLDFLKL